MQAARFHIAHIVPDLRMHGLFGYREIIETLQWGLAELGHEVSVEENGLAPDRTNVILGAQVLPESMVDALPADTIVYNFEQIRGLRPENIVAPYHVAARRLQIWDYCERNLPAWASLNPVFPVKHVPVGWAPILARIPQACAQDIDVLFYGLPGDLRLSIFSQLCNAGMRSVFACGFYGASRDGLIARAKLVLNINRLAKTQVFEVVRVSFLLANAKAVVADLHPETFVEPDLREAVAFAPPEQVAETCWNLLKDVRAREQLGRRGEAIMRQRDIREILTRALTANRVEAH